MQGREGHTRPQVGRHDRETKQRQTISRQTLKVRTDVLRTKKNIGERRRHLSRCSNFNSRAMPAFPSGTLPSNPRVSRHLNRNLSLLEIQQSKTKFSLFSIRGRKRRLTLPEPSRLVLTRIRSRPEPKSYDVIAD